MHTPSLILALALLPRFAALRLGQSAIPRVNRQDDEQASQYYIKHLYSPRETPADRFARRAAVGRVPVDGRGEGGEENAGVRGGSGHPLCCRSSLAVWLMCRCISVAEAPCPHACPGPCPAACSRGWRPYLRSRGRGISTEP